MHFLMQMNSTPTFNIVSSDYFIILLNHAFKFAGSNIKPKNGRFLCFLATLI